MNRWLASRDLALYVYFVGIVAVLGVIPALYVFGSTVPITAQSMGPMLAGAIIGARRGAISMALFLVLVAIGLPLLSGGRGGFSVFTGPSAGFLIGFVVAAAVIGLLVERGPKTLPWFIVANLVGGVVVLYAIGIPVIAWRAHIPFDAALKSSLPFIPGDLAKVVIAALIARGVHRAMPGLLPTQRDRELANV